MHFIYLSCSTRRILAGLGSVFVLMFVLVCCGLFFPYSADPSSPRPKRIFVQVPQSLISDPESKCASSNHHLCHMRSHCSLSGPSHMSLYLRPHAGASLMGWSFGDGTPRFDLSGEYFVFYSHGLDAPAWSFWFEIQVNAPPDEGLISLAVSSHYFFGPDRRSEPLEALLKRFPAWAFPSSWVSTYHMYRY
uniref:Endoplasmic reticulum metallopeptidase 1-like C-terminal domain-containing protein n=1 Tax=Cyprinus carpio TaxID=7962 RepID=A0A8C1LF78_CYPCA